MVNIVSAFLSDLRRPWLWKSAGVGSLLVVGLLGTLLVAAGLEPTREALLLEKVLREACLSLMFTGAGVVGSFSFTADFRSGAFTHRILLFQRPSAFVARATTTLLVALLSGASVGVFFGLSGAFFASAWHPSLYTVIGFAGMAGMGACWGFAIGSLLRDHLMSLFAVPLSLVLPEILPESLAKAGTYLFPFRAADWANQTAVHIPAPGSFFGAAAWLLIVMGAACGVFFKRDLA